MTMSITLHLGRGEHRGPLTVFPIWRRHCAGPEVALADTNDLRIGELMEPSVSHLRATATGQHPVLLLDGDLLVGGRQDRVAVGSRLLAAGRPTTIDVRCVEQERWHGSAKHQLAGRASSLVRGNSDQQEVWRRVDVERARRHRIPDVRGLELMPGQSGVMIGICGTPALIELFATNVMLTAAWPRVLAAAAAEAAGRRGKPTAGWRARQVVTVVDNMRITHSPGEAQTGLSAVSGPYELRGIADGDRLLHASVINREAWAA